MYVFMYYYEKLGTGTWWGRHFVSMALTFRLATVTLCKMGALIEKVDRAESGAKSYVKIILGWVQSIRALQARQGEPEKNWISIYDFVVFMVDNCPENIGGAGGVCVLLEVQRRLVYDEMARSGVRGDELGNYVVSEVANCGLHVVNTFSANYNKTWKAVEESFINEGVDKASLMEDVIGAKLDPVSLASPPAFLPAHIITPENLRAEGGVWRTGGRRACECKH